MIDWRTQKDAQTGAKFFQLRQFSRDLSTKRGPIV